MPTSVATQVRKVSHVTVIVSDLDKALEFYTDTLGMEKRDDQSFASEEGSMRWLTVGCPGQDLSIAIQTPMPAPGAKGDPQDWVGNGTMTVLEVDDCRGLVAALKAKGVTVQAEPEDLPWGVSAIIRDPDGNPFNLVEPKPME